MGHPETIYKKKKKSYKPYCPVYNMLEYLLYTKVIIMQIFFFIS